MGYELLAHGLRIDFVHQEYIAFTTTSLLGEADTLSNELCELFKTADRVLIARYLTFLETLHLPAHFLKPDFFASLTQWTHSTSSPGHVSPMGPCATSTSIRRI